MATNLENVRHRLQLRMRLADKAFERYCLTPSVTHRTDRHALQEGLVSNLWQSWCAFCREAIVGSAIGAVTRAGALTTSSYASNTEEEVAFVAQAASNNQSFSSVRPIKAMRYEPTWGDDSKIGLILSALNPTNSLNLANLTQSVHLISDLQIVRNASAHITSESIQNVQGIQVRYDRNSFRHPSDAVFWIDPISNDYLWKSWIDEIYLLSDLAVS